MRIGILGAGHVGGTLGRVWAKKGHHVMFGVRDPAAPKVAELLATIGGNATAADVAKAVVHAEVVALATPWSATASALRSAGNLTGKIILDCTNPLKDDLSGLTHGHTTSGAEQVAAWAPGARVVKVFNTTGLENMANPAYGTQAATMFYAGDDEAGKTIAAQLARQIGFDPVDAGPLAHARVLEPMALLWIYLAVMKGHGTGIAYRLMHR
jgi:8-hydroxy-5-deazaflavin:NADPH oxidoreductase